jgi:hypothetical protein
MSDQPLRLEHQWPAPGRAAALSVSREHLLHASTFPIFRIGSWSRLGKAWGQDGTRATVPKKWRRAHDKTCDHSHHHACASRCVHVQQGAIDDPTIRSRGKC